MTILDMLGSLFTSVWDLFNGVAVPGLGFSFGSLFLAVLLIKISISIIRHALGFGGSGTGYRSGSARKPKISDNRKGDTH